MSDAWEEASEPEISENDSPPELAEQAAEATEEAQPELSSDPYDPQFYLQQIPVTEEDRAASDLIIADGLYNMAIVYKDGLNDSDEALKTFDLLDARFPLHENKLQAYYHTYLIYLKAGDTAMAEAWKQKIRTTFPESELAISMADPHYEYNLKMMDVVVDSLYQDTYQAYLDGNVNRIRANCAEAERLYATSKLIPKFMFLNALSYVQTRDAEQFKTQLRELIAKYPDADVSALASEMMKGFQRGLLLSASGDNLLARGGLFTIRFGENEAAFPGMDSIPFSPATDVPHQLLIVYPQNSIDDNLLLYTVASFNFGNFIQTDFDIEQTGIGNTIGLLQIKGFNNWTEIMQYLQMIYAPEGYAPQLEQSVVIVPISLENYNILMQGKTLESYMLFFEEHFGKENQPLIQRWKSAQLQEQESRAHPPAEVSAEPAPDEPPLPDPQNSPEPEEETDPIPPDSSAVHEEEHPPVEQKIEAPTEPTEDILDQGFHLTQNATATLNEISADPIRGIQKLFSKWFGKKTANAIDEYAKEQEKAEKERQKQLKAKKLADEKALRNEAAQQEKDRKALQKKNAAEKKASQNAKKKQQAELAKKKKQEAKAKAKERKRQQKERNRTRKRP
jgi:hypothetical protein